MQRGRVSRMGWWLSLQFQRTRQEASAVVSEPSGYGEPDASIGQGAEAISSGKDDSVRSEGRTE